MKGSKVMVALLLGLATGCSPELAGPESWRAAGVLLISGWSGATYTALRQGAGDVLWARPPGQSDYSAPQVLVAPDTVRAGEPFEVTTYTVGASGCWRADGQLVTVLDKVVVLEPYDLHSGSEFCTAALVFPEHRSTVTLMEPGDWTLRAVGRHLRLGQSEREVPITAEKVIRVQ